MLIQSAPPTSVEATMSFASNHREQDLLCKWAPSKTWQSCLETSELPKDRSELLIARDMHANSGVNMVKRIKLQKSSVIVFPVEADTDEASRTAVKKGSLKTLIERDNSVVIALPAPPCAGDFGCSNVQLKRHYNKSYLKVRHSSKFKFDSKSQIVGSVKELKSGNIRSSESEMGLGCNSKIEGDDLSNSDISWLEALDDDPAVREFCVSVLKSHGLLAVGHCSVRNCASAELSGTRNDSSFTQHCKICGKSDDTLNMLLCDNCDEGFHASCCNPKIKFLPTGYWFCHRCSNLDCKVSQENPFLQSPNISWSNGISNFGMGRIALMLKYPEPYRSRVRIGESFQAEVPDWSDQISNDLDRVGEPSELDPAETVGLHARKLFTNSDVNYDLQVCFSDKFLQPNFISNWLQCQEVLNDEGTICGKWRRAPFTEVQTDGWDCSCSVLWDPLHSDCAVPQELETNEVLRQLKYSEQLRSRFGVKKRT